MNTTMGRTLLAPATACFLLLAACGGGGAGDTAASPKPTDTTQSPKETPTGSERVEVEVEAEDFAFDTSEVTVPAGSEVELKFKNRDADIPHTFTVYETEEAVSPIFDTNSLTGVAEDRFTFTAPSEPGTYFFRCDVHNEMNGDFVVE
jgi:plastocyanin